MKKLLSIFLVVLTLVMAVIPAMAAETTSLETSSVDDDLKHYDSNYLNNYHVDYADTGIYLITVQEDGYSPDGKTADYALYFYLYNPSQKTVSSSDYNKIQIANKWENGDPVSYAKYTIDLVSVSTNKRFIKVKLSGSKYPSSAFCYTNKDGSRSYSVSGIELYGQDTGVKTADLKDYSLAYTYTFSGYSTNNTLVSKRANLTTIMLDVHQTSYLTGDSGKETHELENGWYSNQINSVYFTIPEKFEESLGKLYAIDYEYYQYRTAPMLITDNQTIYDTIYPFQAREQFGGVFGYEIGDRINVLTGDGYVGTWYGYYWGDKNTSSTGITSYSYTYDEYPELGTYQDYFTALLKFDDISDRDSILISAEELQNYFKNYFPTTSHGTVVINHSGKTVGSSRYNGDLFDLDYFSQNYYRREVDISDNFSLPSLADTLPSGLNGFWKNLVKYGWDVAFNKEKYDNSLENVKYIQKVTSSDISSDNTTASEALLVCEDDVNDIRNTVSNAAKNDAAVYLLRYAASDDYYYLPLEWNGGVPGNDVAMVQQTVYLDFDIIELSFKDSDNKVTVIPVTSSPSDGFTGIENNTPEDSTLGDVITDLFLWSTGIAKTKDSNGWLTKLMALVLVGIGVYLLIKFSGVIFPALGKALSATGGFVKRTSSKAYNYGKRKYSEYRSRPKRSKKIKKQYKNNSKQNYKRNSPRRSRSYGRNNRYRY